jgi:trk system potassium uptake protein TrkH
MIGRMSLFDALCHALTTMPTGGFSTKNASVAQFRQSLLRSGDHLFMVLAGINFSLHYQMLRGNRWPSGGIRNAGFFWVHCPGLR